MKRIWHYSLCTLMAAAILLVPAGPVFSVTKTAGQKYGIMKTGNPVPDFKLVDLEGNEFHLAEAKNHKVVFLILWAVWCDPCIEEIPKLNELQEKYGERGLEILGVAVPYGQDEKGVRGFARRNTILYPLLFDDNDVISEQLGAMFVPHNYLIGADGVLSYEGASIPNNIESRIEALLKEIPEIPEVSVTASQTEEDGE